jgi:hypothetical protein
MAASLEFGVYHLKGGMKRFERPEDSRPGVDTPSPILPFSLNLRFEAVRNVAKVLMDSF